MDRGWADWAAGSTRKVAVAIGGTLVLVVGALMLFLPGPAIVVVPAGLAILGLEFEWAKRWQDRLRERSAALFEAAKRRASTASR